MRRVLEALKAQARSFEDLKMVAFFHQQDYPTADSPLPRCTISVKRRRGRSSAVVRFTAVYVITVEALSDTRVGTGTPAIKVDLGALTDRLKDAIDAAPYYAHAGPPWVIIHGIDARDEENRVEADSKRRQALIFFEGEASWGR